MERKILIVDDETDIREILQFNLENAGFEVDCAYSAEEALEKLGQEHCLILLDVMLPGLDGFEVCRRIRATNKQMGIIMLTARTQEMDKVSGLLMGADDYITKPFNILEVKARIKAIMRRTGTKEAKQKNDSVITLGDMKMDRESRRVFISDKEVNLTTKEFEVLELLIMNPGKVYGRDNLLKIIWGEDFPGDVRTVDVHIRRLREKIENNPSEPKYVQTKWGLGYFFKG